MDTVSAYEAKTHLPRLLKEVEGGATYTITRHGAPVAVLVPVQGRQRRTRAETIVAIREFRKARFLGGIAIKDLIEEGRR